MSLKKSKFYIGNIFNDPFTGDGLYTSFRDVAGLSDTTKNSELKEQIYDHNRKKKEFGCYKTEYCDKLWIDEACQALAELYGKKIALVRQDQDAKGKRVIRIDLYVRETSMDDEIVHILYDEVKNKFSPLWVAKTNNSMERITRLHHNDAVKNLLYKFIRNDLKYKDPINSDGYDRTDDGEASTSTDESNNSENLSDIIAAVDSNSQIHGQECTSSGHVPLSKNNMKSLPLMLDNNNGDEQIKNSQDDTNRASTCYERHHTPVTLEELTESMKSVVESEYQSYEVKMSEVTEATHEFRRHSVSGAGNSCLFRTVHYLLDFLKNTSVQHLRDLVAYHIYNDENIREIAPGDIDNCDNIDDYCSKLRRDLMGGQPELIALSALFFIRIIVILVNTANSQSEGTYSEIGDENLSKCIYVQLDKSKEHYDPLRMVNKQNLNDEIKIFPCKNQMVKNILAKSGFVPSNLSSQKKRSAGEEHSQSISNAKRLRTDPSPFMSIPSASQQSKASLPYREEIKSDKKSSDFQQNAGLSVATPSSSNANSNNQHFLKISIREDFILANAQVNLDVRIATEDVNRGPSCKFQVKLCDNQIAYLDHMEIVLANENEQRDSKGIRQIQLPLIDMCAKTNRSMKVEQPLDFYRSPKNNRLAITKQIDEFGALKQANYLHGVCFEIALYSKQPGQDVFHQHDIQFLSHISVENKDSDMDVYSGI